MDWFDFQLARQFLVEERIGTRVREAKAIEDAKAKDTIKRTPRG